MEIKKITKTEKGGKRLFVEIGKKLKEGGFLPGLKKGDRIAMLPIRKLDDKQMAQLVGKYIKFFDMSEEESYALCFEGVLKINRQEYWEDDEYEPKKQKYALFDSEIGPIDAFNNLNEVYDLQVLPGREKFVNQINCIKCKKQFFEAYKYCPYCGKYNRLFQKEEPR